MDERIAARLMAQRDFEDNELPQIRLRGLTALRRLLPIAQGDTGQSGVIARFLLGLYNGGRFPFNLNELRGIDRTLLLDYLALLEMDAYADGELHRHIVDGKAVLER